MNRPDIASLSSDAADLLILLADGATRTQRDAAYALWGFRRGQVRDLQAAMQELRLAGWPVVSAGEGIHLESDPAVVRSCALALRRRAITQLLTARALRETAARMEQPATLWERVS